MPAMTGIPRILTGWWNPCYGRSLWVDRGVRLFLREEARNSLFHLALASWEPVYFSTGVIW